MSEKLPYKLSDDELTQLVAEKIMGWLVVANESRFDGEEWILPANGAAPLENPMRLADWQPLTDWRAAGEIVEKMRADGWISECQLYPSPVANGLPENRWMFRKNGVLTGDSLWKETPLRAITIAALLACGLVTEAEL